MGRALNVTTATELSISMKNYMKIYKSLLDRLKNQHLAIDEIINNTTHHRINLRPTPEKWNIHDNIAHLARYQIIFIDRVNRILNENIIPHFDRYKAENDPDFESFRAMTDYNLLTSIKEERLKLIALIFSLSETDLEKSGVHKSSEL